MISPPYALLDAYGSSPDPFEPNFTKYAAAILAFEALRAVLDVHRPDSGQGSPWCRGCDPNPATGPDWPCATVRVIVAKLEEHPAFSPDRRSPTP